MGAKKVIFKNSFQPFILYYTPGKFKSEGFTVPDLTLR